MSCIPDRKTTDKMYSLYQQGFSLSSVAKAFLVTRQSVYTRFKRAGLVMRSAIPLPFVMFRGMKYTMRENGYYANSIGVRTYLHRDVWEISVGKIPAGMDVHHKNGDKSDNRIENLEILTSSDHGSRHGFGGNQYTGSLITRPLRK